MSANNFTIDGFIGVDPRTRQVGNSTLTEFSIGHQRRVKGENVTTWYQIKDWRGVTDPIAQWLKKGTSVMCYGRFEPSVYEKDGVERTSLTVNLYGIDFAFTGNNNKDETKGTAPDRQVDSDDGDSWESDSFGEDEDDGPPWGK